MNYVDQDQETLAILKNQGFYSDPSSKPFKRGDLLKCVTHEWSSMMYGTLVRAKDIHWNSSIRQWVITVYQYRYSTDGRYRSSGFIPAEMDHNACKGVDVNTNINEAGGGVAKNPADIKGHDATTVKVVVEVKDGRVDRTHTIFLSSDEAMINGWLRGTLRQDPTRKFLVLKGDYIVGTVEPELVKTPLHPTPQKKKVTKR